MPAKKLFQTGALALQILALMFQPLALATAEAKSNIPMDSNQLNDSKLQSAEASCDDICSHVIDPSKWTRSDDQWCADHNSQTDTAVGASDTNAASVAPEGNRTLCPYPVSPADLAAAGNDYTAACIAVNKRLLNCKFRNTQVEAQCMAYTGSAVTQPREKVIFALDVMAAATCATACVLERSSGAALGGPVSPMVKTCRIAGGVSGTAEMLGVMFLDQGPLGKASGVIGGMLGVGMSLQGMNNPRRGPSSFDPAKVNPIHSYFYAATAELYSVLDAVYSVVKIQEAQAACRSDEIMNSSGMCVRRPVDINELQRLANMFPSAQQNSGAGSALPVRDANGIYSGLKSAQPIVVTAPAPKPLQVGITPSGASPGIATPTQVRTGSNVWNGPGAVAAGEYVDPAMSEMNVGTGFPSRAPAAAITAPLPLGGVTPPGEIANPAPLRALPQVSNMWNGQRAPGVPGDGVPEGEPAVGNSVPEASPEEAAAALSGKLLPPVGITPSNTSTTGIETPTQAQVHAGSAASNGQVTPSPNSAAATTVRKLSNSCKSALLFGALTGIRMMNMKNHEKVKKESCGKVKELYSQAVTADPNASAAMANGYGAGGVGANSVAAGARSGAGGNGSGTGQGTQTSSGGGLDPQMSKAIDGQMLTQSGLDRALGPRAANLDTDALMKAADAGQLGSALGNMMGGAGGLGQALGNLGQVAYNNPPASMMAPNDGHGSTYAGGGSGGGGSGRGAAGDGMPDMSKLFGAGGGSDAMMGGGSRSIAFDQAEDTDIFHSHTDLNLFQIVSKRIGRNSMKLVNPAY